MSLAAVGALAVGLALDTAFEEFPQRIHPVAWFGRAVTPLDRSWAYPRLVGATIALGLPIGAAAVAGFVAALAVAVNPIVGGAVAGLVVFATTSLARLLSVAEDVIDLTATDPAAARTSVRALVGRKTDDLTPVQLRSAAVESAAENLADGLVAPLLAFALGARVSLAVGVAGAAWVKAVNTLDSMLGYHSKPVGGASARLDDLVMWLPARTSAVLLAAAGRSPRALARAREWSHAPTSPNSGWPMATLAAALDIRLKKRGAYVLNPDADLPSVERAREGVRVVGLAGLGAFVLCGVIAWS
ncbi:CobD/CbiB family cobalamin biosynthesis protein [Halococcus saccharolyticus]|uniref:Probable cobalamin biosynthesis protein CobD n=1 Tax=Halococcus saccharolyticus DSM 5350 TaxID=1227455 RepID=M0MJE8_9EURY|nr:CobD/CbiB family cobalamin biosynthesis protein [Halococcus saccharolyticus]EMA44859.1 cobalamin biosynthesis protein CobD [Halococcus saccharolyticus DSM 5350]